MAQHQGGAMNDQMAPVASPCNNVCRIDDATGWCIGCARNLDEIAAWSSLDDDARRRVRAQLPARHAQLNGLPGPGAAGPRVPE
jgi:uncharacterized protein